MARGKSGRVVIEIDPATKNQLHAALAADQLTMKEWFLHNALRYLDDRIQPSLFSSVHSRPQGIPK